MTQKISISRRYLIWLIGVSFVLFQFFLQLSFGVILGAIMSEMKLSALTASLLGSAFYYVYTSLQIPAGILFDRQSARRIITLTAFICSIGCLIFSHSSHAYSLFWGRFIIGTGSAFAFVGVSHLLRTYFPLRQFAFLIGLSETLGFMVTMGGIIGLGILLVYTDWRGFITISAFVGLCISVCAWWLIPDDKPKLSAAAPYQSLSLIIKSKTQWINGAFVGLGFTIITVFAALWAVPFMQVKFAINLRVASLLDAIIFLGAGISCPLFGYLNNKLRKRRPLMIYSCLFTSFFLSVCLFFPFQSLISFSLTLFLMGISCGSYMLSYTISNEISPPGALSTSTGFTNTLAMLSAPIMQIITGSLLDWHSDFTHHYQVSDYQVALSILPGSLIIAALLVFFLPEKN